AGSAAVVRELIKGGANVNAVTTSGGATALHFAAQQGSVDAVTALLDKGAAVDAKESAFGQTPVMWAAAANRVGVVEALVKRGANLKETSKVEDIPARERSDRNAQGLRNRRVAALKAADTPPGRATPPPEV